ncbi:unnamed protein product [Urochloa humidicola]
MKGSIGSKFRSFLAPLSTETISTDTTSVMEMAMVLEHPSMQLLSSFTAVSLDVEGAAGATVEVQSISKLRVSRWFHN